MRRGTRGSGHAPGVTRTPDQRFRKPLLYPSELQGQEIVALRRLARPARSPEGPAPDPSPAHAPTCHSWINLIADPRGAGAPVLAIFVSAAPSVPASHSLARRSSCALIATMIVLSDMSTAPTAGERTIPHGARTPAASGMATML